MRIAWITDPHFDLVPEPGEVDEFLEGVARQSPDAVFVTGDIAESPTVEGSLRRMATAIPVPIYFVLGNHDYYHGRIAETRAAVAVLAERTPNLVYLPQSGGVSLTTDTVVIGHGGWADGRVGDFERSLVKMWDDRLIGDLADVRSDRQALKARLEALADEGAASLSRDLETVCALARRVIVLTHVPPFRGACWYMGQISDDHWAPHFVSAATGEAILAVMDRHPECHATVLCGHTHSPGEYQPRSNVRVLTGAASHGRPEITGWIEL